MMMTIILILQSTPDNSNLQGKQKKVWVIGSSTYRGYYYVENVLKGNENSFELAGGSSYRGFELPGIDCITNNFYQNLPTYSRP